MENQAAKTKSPFTFYLLPLGIKKRLELFQTFFHKLSEAYKVRAKNIEQRTFP
jgi:hypothetical protein